MISASRVGTMYIAMAVGRSATVGVVTVFGARILRFCCLSCGSGISRFRGLGFVHWAGCSGGCGCRVCRCNGCSVPDGCWFCRGCVSSWRVI